MKNIYKVALLIALTTLVYSCKEEDEGKLPEIEFKTGSGYISSDQTLAKGASFKIGIEANKEEDKDVLTKFNISRSVNGAASTTVKDQSLSGSDADHYEYDFTGTMDTISGQTNKYTFTITNRDGLVNQVSLTLTVE
ncbi:MAG: hypothetical protein GC181_08910 [Bacteroidetes bacterium]|nr:hypothetical protein [Bacteroidota bacterium]